jgi:hypothetical protein
MGDASTWRHAWNKPPSRVRCKSVKICKLVALFELQDLARCIKEKTMVHTSSWLVAGACG